MSSHVSGAYFEAGVEVGGPYEISAIEATSKFSGSNPTDWPGGGIPGIFYRDINANDYDEIYYNWFIDDIKINSSSERHINAPIYSFDYLHNTYGLNLGLHTIELKAQWIHCWFDEYYDPVTHARLSIGVQDRLAYGSDTATLNIVPEPATISIFALGGIILFKRKQ